MSDGALRSIFAEFGFDVDVEELEKLEAVVQQAAKKMGLLPKAADAAAAGTSSSLRAAVDAKRAAAAADATVEAQWTSDVYANAKKRAEVEKAQGEGNFTRKAPRHFGAARWEKPPETKSWGDMLSRLDESTAKGVGTKLGPALQQLTQRFPAAGRAAKAFGLDLRNTEVAGRVAIGGTLAMVAVLTRAAHAAFDFAESFSQESEQLRETARDMRVTTTELQGLQHAGVESGVGADRLTRAVGTLGESLRNAEIHGSGVGWGLRRMGVDMRDASGQVRPTADVLDDLALAFDRVPSPTHRARMAMQLFGADGRRMLNVMHGGPGGIRALREEMEALGGGVTPEAVAAGQDFTRAQDRMKRASDSLRSVLATALLPALSWITTKAAELGGYFARLSRGTHVVQVALMALGVVGAAIAAALLIAWAPVLTPILATAAAVAGLVLVFDDLWTFIEGGDSSLGRFIDSMTHVGASVEMARALRESWEELIDTVSRAIEKVAEFLHLTEEPAIGRLTSPRLDGRANAPPPAPGAQRVNPASQAAPTPDWTMTGQAPPNVRVVRGRVARGGAGLARGGAAAAAARGASVSAPTAPAVAHVVAVPAPTGGARHSSRSVTQHNTFHLHGPSTEQLARHVGEVLTEQQRRERDGDHPIGDDDG